MAIEDQMRELLAEASVIADGQTQSYDSSTSHGKAESKILSRAQNGASAYEEIKRRFDHARTHQERLDAVVWARRELKQWKGLYKPPPPVSDKDRVQTEWTDVPSKDVAKIFGVTERTVRRWRGERAA